MLGLRAIVPKHAPIASNIEDLIAKELSQVGFIGLVTSQLQTYPPAEPWKNPPRSGLRAGGRRTGGLGRGWTISNRSNGGRLAWETANRTHYAVYVQGPTRGARGRRQTAVMRSRSWPNITRVASANWRRTRPRLISILDQKAPAVRARRPTLSAAG